MHQAIDQARVLMDIVSDLASGVATGMAALRQQNRA
jgi:hypothetical protein